MAEGTLPVKENSCTNAVPTEAEHSPADEKEEEEEEETDKKLDTLVKSASNLSNPLLGILRDLSDELDLTSNESLLEPFCRICHQGDSVEKNLSPCNCRGTMALVHKSCLEKWLAASASTNCEICGYLFTVKRTPKYDLMTAVLKWMSDEDSKQDRLWIMTDTIALTILLPFIFFANHQTTVLLDIFKVDDIDICDLFSFFTEADMDMNDLAMNAGRFFTYFLVGAVSALDFLTIGWVLMRIEAYYAQWRYWYKSQSIISLVLDEEEVEK